MTHNDMIAYFPDAWSSKSEFLGSSFPDVPMGELELIRELLGPSSDRTVFGRLVDLARQLRERTRGVYANRVDTEVEALKFSRGGQKLEPVRTHSARN
jgi:hypothetical protein